jgi:hypothetical protein
MKNPSTILKIFSSASVSAICISICILLLQSFKSGTSGSPGDPVCPAFKEEELMRNREDVKKLYNNFIARYPENDFKEHGGSLSKGVICNLLSKMRDDKDTMVYYLFGRTDNGDNLIMLFNDPAYNDLDNTSKFRSCPPYCPPNCNTTLMEYVR